MEIYSDVEKRIESFNESAVLLRERFENPKDTFLSVLGKERSESAHSNFLKWILECKFAGNGNENKALEYLWRVIANAEENNPHLSKESDEYLALKNGCPRIKKVHREFGCSNGKVDILIEAEMSTVSGRKTVLIIIENKIDAPETKAQTRRYYDYFSGTIPKMEGEVKPRSKSKNSKGRELQFYIYLTTSSKEKLKRQLCDCDKYININYTAICSEVLKPLLGLSELDSRARSYIEGYIDGCSIPSTARSKDIDNINKKNVIAMKEEDEKMLIEFWEKNEDLILNAMLAYKNDNEPEKAEIIHDIVEAYRASTRDYQKYVLNYGQPTAPLNKGKTVKTVFETLFNNGKKTEAIGCTCKDFNKKNAILSKEEYEELSNGSSYGDRFDKIKDKDGCLWYISKQWDKYSFNDFMEWASKYGFTFTPA